MSHKSENVGFTCLNCGGSVPPSTDGGYRNHCPFCLHSLHVDIEPGDRDSGCMGLMEPVSAVYTGNKGWTLIHRCKKCGFERKNMVSTETACPDDWDLVVKLSVQE